MQLFIHGAYLVYRFSLIFYHNWNNIYIIKVTNFISLVYYQGKCRKTNNIWFFHFANLPLLCVDVCFKQNNTLKHGFYSLLICLFLFPPTNVGNFENIYDHMSMNNNYFLSYFSVYCVFFLMPSIEKLHQPIMAWCSPINFKQSYQFHYKGSSILYSSHLHPCCNSLLVLDCSNGMKINLFSFGKSTNIVCWTILHCLLVLDSKIEQLKFENLGIDYYS
jgi:hypothetical protein